MSKTEAIECENGVCPEIRLYKLRWLTLILFAMYAASNSMQWIQYCIISDTIMRYYGVSALAVDWTSLITMATYPVFLIPGSYIIEKMGLRTCVLLGVTVTTIGTWIKVFSVRPDLFWLGFLGQGVVFSAQVFILSLPPRLAAVWFAEDEVSTACSLGALGTQFGIAAGFIIPRMIVKNHEKIEDIGTEISYMFYGVATYTTIVAVLLIIYFKSEPELPPNTTQAELRNSRREYTLQEFYACYKSLLTNKPFLMLILAFGINVGVFAGICTVLNQFILLYFPENGDDSGRIGLLMVVIGMVGSVIFGYFLDKTRKYKETTLFIYVMVVIGLACFMLALESGKIVLVYVTALILGFFQNAYLPVGYELAAELTFPEPETTSSGLIISSSQFFGVVLTMMMYSVFNAIGPLWAMISMAILLVFGCVLTAATPNILRRQDAYSGKGHYGKTSTIVM